MKQKLTKLNVLKVWKTESNTVGVMSEFVVGCIGCQSAETDTERKERLGDSCIPNFQAAKFLPLRREKEK